MAKCAAFDFRFNYWAVLHSAGVDGVFGSKGVVEVAAVVFSFGAVSPFPAADAG